MNRPNITRMIILSLLENGEMTCPQLRKEFTDIGGLSTGTFYPQLHMMHIDGLITQSQTMKNAFEITEEGKAQLIVEHANMEAILNKLKDIKKR